MAPLPVCPDDVTLQQLSAGALADAHAELLEQHLLDCSRCCAHLQALEAEDTLLSAVRAARPSAAAGPERALVRGLIDRLQDLRPTPAVDDVPGRPDGPTDATDRFETVPGPAPGPTADNDATATGAVFAFLAPAQAPEELGRLGPYRVLKVLGKGGMGIVFEAEDPALGRRVALKVMLPHLATDPSARQRFLREARAVAAIDHDHIVRVNQVGEDRGVAFLAMPLLRGESLEERLRGAGMLPLAETLRIGREVALGLAAAHAQGLIHRDVKPANIWLEATGNGTRVKLLDFGLARVSGDAAPLTEPGALLGTPAYMAPEQALGVTLDHRCDLFSLGTVLYRTRTGEAPFKRGDTLATLEALVRDVPRPPREINPELPVALAELIGSLLAKEPAARPASASLVAARLEAIERSSGGAAAAPVGRPQPRAEPPRASVQPPMPPPALPRARRWGCWLAAVALVLAGLGLALVQFGPALQAYVERWRQDEAPAAGGPSVPADSAEPADPLLRGALLLFAFEKEDFYQKGGDTYVRDLSGRGNDGLCDEVVATAEGKAGGGLKCGGTGQVRLPGALFNRRANYTITAWVRLADDGRAEGELGDVVIESARTNDREPVFTLGLMRDGSCRLGAWNRQRQQEAGDFWRHAETRGVVPPFPQEQWSFLAFALQEGSVDSGVLHVFGDGRRYGLTTQLVDTTGEVRTRLGVALTGTLDEVTVFPRVLSAEEIAALRQRGNDGRPLGKSVAAVP